MLNQQLKKLKNNMEYTNITEIDGDLLQFPNNIDIIIHQANCQNAMGSGVAGQLREQFPEAWQADCEAAKTRHNKLGYFSACKITSKEFETPKYVINLYGQQYPGTDSRKTDYEALYSGFERIKKLLDDKNQEFHLGFPEIGCGLAGGDWHVVKSMIESVFGNQPNYKITIVHYKPE